MAGMRPTKGRPDDEGVGTRFPRTVLFLVGPKERRMSEEHSFTSFEEHQSVDRVMDDGAS